MRMESKNSKTHNLATFLAIIACLLFGLECHGQQYSSGKPVEDTDSLIKLLSDKNAKVREKAADSLRIFGPDSFAAIPKLVEVLRDKDAHVRLAAAKALISIDPEQRELVLNVVVKDLKDLDPHARSAAIDFLYENEERSKTYSVALSEALTDQFYEVRYAAGYTLKRMELDDQCLPILVKALGHKDWMVRIEAASNLGRLKSPANQDGLPTLRKAFKDEQPAVRSAAAEAVLKIEPNDKEAMKVLVNALEDQDCLTRNTAARALLMVDRKHPAALNAFARWLQDKDSDRRKKTVLELGRIAKLNYEVIPLLASALKDGDYAVRSSVICDLRNLGPVAKPAVPALIEAMQHTDWDWTYPSGEPRRGPRCDLVERCTEQ